MIFLANGGTLSELELRVLYLVILSEHKILYLLRGYDADCWYRAVRRVGE